MRSRRATTALDARRRRRDHFAITIVQIGAELVEMSRVLPRVLYQVHSRALYLEIMSLGVIYTVL